MGFVGKLVTPEVMRARLIVAASKRKREDRRKLLRGIDDESKKLLTMVKNSVVAAKLESIDLISEEKINELVDIIVTGRKEKMRLNAAEALAKANEVINTFITEARITITKGGRSGDVSFSETSTTTSNPRLDVSLILDDFRCRVVHPIIQETEEGFRTVKPERPKIYNVVVRKPGELSKIRDAGFSPDFISYLGKEEKLYLRSYGEWLTEKNEDETEASRRRYEEELERALQGFEDYAFKRRYCKANDIPMPGIHRGHRLLRLSLPIEPDDFRENGTKCPIYEGSLGIPTPSNIDYEELVRRYVAHVKAVPRLFFELEKIADEDIEGYYEKSHGVIDPKVLELFTEATKTAIHNQKLIDYVANAVIPENIAEWLKGEDAEEINHEILTVWEGVGLPGVTEISETAPQWLLPASEFIRNFRKICVPIPEFRGQYDRSHPDYVEILEDHHRTVLNTCKNARPEDWEADDETGAIFNCVKAAITDLINSYEKAWMLAKSKLGQKGLWELRDEIKLSGYEMKAYVYCLFPQAFSTTTVGLNQYQRAALGKLNDEFSQLELVITPEDLLGSSLLFWTTILAFDENDEPLMSSSYPSAEQIHYIVPSDKAKAILDAVTTSYRTIVDVIISSLRSGIEVQELPPDVQKNELYKQWTESFKGFLEEIVREQQVINDNLMVFRLTPKTGSYGEVPTRGKKEGAEDYSITALPPEHPTRLTEAYTLVPIPEKFFFFNYPTVYLREDYSLKIRHRAFGIGDQLYSLSLLPEEEQKISMKSFKDTKMKVSQSTAENIFEETGSETASDFAKEMTTENERESSSQSESSVSAKASASFLWASASVETAHSSQSSARSFAKNTSSVTNKLASKLSSKRNVTIDTKKTVDTETELHSEISTERTIRNPNKGHTITFHWFQMTRKLVTELNLEDINLVYTSGKHNIARIFVNGEVPSRNSQQQEIPKELFVGMPADVARRMPPNSAIVVVTEPYTESISLASANAFLARTFKPQKAAEINATIWRVIGYDQPSPDGLGVTAFCADNRDPVDPEKPDDKWDYYVSLAKLNPKKTYSLDDSNHAEQVAADKISVEGQPDFLYLANLDLRYKVIDGLVPSKHIADKTNVYSLPRLLLSEEKVVNTNGVYCDAMVGQCTALEDYLQRHRDLDLIEKKIQVGQQELDFKWALAKNNLVEVMEDKDKAWVAIVKEKEGTEAFKESLEVEKERMKEQKEISKSLLEKKKIEKELELLGERINELKKKIELMGTTPELKVDVPDGAKVEVKANVSIDAESDETKGGKIKVE